MRQTRQTTEIDVSEGFPLGLVLRGKKTSCPATRLPTRDPKRYGDEAGGGTHYLFLKELRGGDGNYWQRFLLYDDGSLISCGGGEMPDLLIGKKIKRGDLSYLTDEKEDVEEFERVTTRIREWLIKKKKLSKIPMPRLVRK